MEYYPRLDEHIKKPLFTRVAARYKFNYDLFKPLLRLIENHQAETKEDDAIL